ncbi:MAG TPA: hypothetical protein ENI85_03565 [Deltaproteobacteria bacterium]|nr:hypothetical protein [Deltaproteobacteria bacterium]
MEWLGPVMIGFLVAAGVCQFVWTYALSAIARKTDQSDLMQVLAWVPILQLAPMLAAGGGSIGRFLLGGLAVVLGNAVLIGVGAMLGGFGKGVMALGMLATLLLCTVYFGRLAWNTAVARGLPGGVGLLLFVPLVNFFVYPYIAFHDGLIVPNKIGLVLGLVLIVGSTASSIGTANRMTEKGVFSPDALLALRAASMNAVPGAGDESGLPPGTLPLFAPTGGGSSVATTPRPEASEASMRTSPPPIDRAESESIRALYRVKGRFDTLDSLTTPENLRNHDLRVRALGIVQSIRVEIDANRTELGETAYRDLADHLLRVEARLNAPTFAASPVSPNDARGRVPIGPAALATSSESDSRPSRNISTPPLHPFPVEAKNECPPGTEIRTRKDEESGRDEEWCQQLKAYGGLRHGWYARYRPDGKPESMGQYENGLRVGVWTRFHPSGQVRAQAEFQKGLQHGWVLAFDETGKRTRSALFENGVRVPSR